jgi:hypothetical protein
MRRWPTAQAWPRDYNLTKAPLRSHLAGVGEEAALDDLACMADAALSGLSIEDQVRNAAALAAMEQTSSYGERASSRRPPLRGVASTACETLRDGSGHRGS